MAIVLPLAACEGQIPAPATGASDAAAPIDVPSAPDLPEASSLLGEPLFAPPLPDELRRQREQQLADAREAFDNTPGSWVWVGRRTAYLGRYRQAIRLFSQGLDEHPGEPHLLRHRGHRHLTLRDFELAVDDLSRAAQAIAGQPDETEPDGLPNARGIPVSTLHSNIWYHLGLAQYLRGNFDAALTAYEEGKKAARNPDLVVSNAYWHFLTLRRLGREEEAATLLARISPGLEVIENGTYHRLLLAYKEPPTALEALLAEAEGGGGLDFATTAYGVGMGFLLRGERERAREIFRKIREDRAQWAAFGFIAAEAELARMR